MWKCPGAEVPHSHSSVGQVPSSAVLTDMMLITRDSCGNLGAPNDSNLTQEVTKNQTSIAPTTACCIVHFMWLTTPYKWMQSRDHKARRHLTRITLHNVPTSTLATWMPEHHYAQAKTLCTVHTLHQSSAPTDSIRQTDEQLSKHISRVSSRQTWTQFLVKRTPSLSMWWHNSPLYTALSSPSF